MILRDEVHHYAEQFTSAEDAVLAQLNRKTNLEIPVPEMISGHLQGKFLEMISTMLRPNYIVEIGTYTAYSTICLAKGLSESGKIISVDNNKYLEDIQKEFIEKSGLGNKIELQMGNAATLIPLMDDNIDLAFIDADKINYHMYYDLLLPKMRKGGFILADNVLYDNEVLDVNNASRNGKAIAAFNEKIQEDVNVENILLPLRDGIMIMRKK